METVDQNLTFLIKIIMTSMTINSTATSLKESISNSRGDRLSLDYSFNDTANIEQINGAFLAHIINGWCVGGRN